MQTGLIAFDAIAKINRMNIDLRSLVREYSLSEKEIEVEELLRIMKQFEFKAKIKELPVDEIAQRYPLPAIILKKDNAYSVLLKVDREKKHALIYKVEEGSTADVSYEELSEITDNKFIILS